MNFPKNRALLACALFATLAILLGSLLSLAAARASTRPASAASVFAPDKGKFRIMLAGKEVGKEEYEISPSGGNWIARGSSEIQSEKGPTQHITGSLELRADGAGQVDRLAHGLVGRIGAVGAHYDRFEHLRIISAS